MSSVALALNGPLVKRFSIADRFLALALALFMTVSLTACSFGVDQVLSDIDLLLQTASVVCSTIAVVSPADAAACTTIANVGSAGIVVIQTTYDDYKASGSATDLAKLQAALAALKINLPAALAAAHIVDPAVVVLVTNWVNLVIGVVNDIIGLIPQLQIGQTSTLSSVSKRAVAVAASLPTPEALKAQWQAQVCNGNVACGDLVKVHHIHSKFWHRASIGILK